jgi:hypothetical protein
LRNGTFPSNLTKARPLAFVEPSIHRLYESVIDWPFQIRRWKEALKHSRVGRIGEGGLSASFHKIEVTLYVGNLSQPKRIPSAAVGNDD